MSSNHLAPEWERQDAIIIVWPHSHSDWATNLDSIELIYLKISKYICQHQRLILVSYDDAHQLQIKQALIKYSIKIENVTFTNIPTNDTWVRDYGPICVNSNKQPFIHNFEFDAWGLKYSHDLDNAFSIALVNQLDLDANCHHSDQVLEAGNIEINSLGELLCTSSCFKRKNIALPIELADLENKFIHWFGCSKIYWINAVQLIGDDTDGHIDTLARFCTDNIIVYSSVGNSNDANNAALLQLEVQLQSIKKKTANRIELIPLPLPKPVFSFGKQIPANYTNFLITNESVLVPTFSDKQDNHTLKLFDALFPTREIIGIESSTLTQQFGGLHCATMQIPQGILQ